MITARLVLIAALLVPSLAFAEVLEGPGPVSYKDYDSGIAAEALSSDRVTDHVNVGGYSVLSVTVLLTDANTSMTGVEVSCEVSKTGVTGTWSWITAKNIGADGVSVSKKYVDRLPHAGTTNYTARIGVMEQYARCTIHGVGTVTAVDDVATVHLRAGVL